MLLLRLGILYAAFNKRDDVFPAHTRLFRQIAEILENPMFWLSHRRLETNNNPVLKTRDCFSQMKVIDALEVWWPLNTGQHD